jgi:hypothetical protein
METDRRGETRMESSSPARLYCLLVGALLVVVGILGFFYEASFATGDSIRSRDVFGILSVNGWHNLLHIAVGGLLLIAAGGQARGGALLAGVLYVVLSALGFIATGDGGIGFLAEKDTLFRLVPVNSEDNLLHLILGITGIVAARATREGAAGAPAPAA